MYAPICIVCGDPAEGHNGKLRCSNHACTGAAVWWTVRVWGHLNCQGHTARLEAVCLTANKEQKP